MKPSRIYTKANKKNDAKAKADAGKSTISFTESHRLERLLEEVGRLETEITKLEAFLSQPNMFTEHPAKFQKATDVLFERRAALTSAEAEWIKLEEKVSS